MLAQDASAQLKGALCKDHRDLWNVQEASHESASSQFAAAHHAAPLLEICVSCPVINRCRRWASVDKYTGIAAGAAWVNGVVRPPEWVRHQRGRSKIVA